jgi:hypothetical protein
MESEVRNTMPDLPATSEIARLARSPSALLNHLSNMSSDEEPDGSFQPPAPEDVNATAGAGTAVPPAVEPDVGAEPQAEPTPIRADLPVRNPQPRGNVVPGDPTLN